MQRYRFGCLDLSSAGRSVAADGTPIELTYRQFEALRILAEAGGSVVDRDSLHQQIWPEAVVDDGTLNKCISELRRTLAEHDPATEYVETVRGRGYRIAVPIERVGPRAADADRVTPEPISGTPAPFWTSSRKAVGALAAVAVLATGGWAAWSEISRTNKVAELRAQGQQLYRAGDYMEASQAMRQAIALDPTNGRIYGELAHVVHKMRDPTVDPGQAIELAEKGVELTPDCAECQGTLGFFLFYHGWQWERAMTHYEQALRLEPGQSGIRTSYAFLLAATGRTAEALDQAQYSADAQPLGATRHAVLAQVLYLNRQYDQAIEAADRAIGLDRGKNEAWEYRARAEFRLGQLEEGLRTMLAERYKDRAAVVGQAVDSGGAEAGLRKLLELTGGWPERSTVSWRRAAWLALLGDDNAALEALEEAVRIRNINLMFVAVDPIFGHLHDHPRFQAVLKEMGLAEAVQEVPSEVSAR